MSQAHPPLWKIRRELKRFPSSLGSKLRASFGPLHRLRHDLTAHRTVRVTQGDRPATAEPVVLLIYQPKALLSSLFLTLEHLVDNGLSVVLVANHPLDEEKMAALRPWCHKLIERPNIGYDFGGYREGVLHVLDTMPDAERLFVMNDSNWFPVRPGCTLIDQSRTAPENVYGIYRGSARGRPEDLHIQSYFYRFDRTIFRDPEFRRFWKAMPLIAEKRLVVRYREVGLTRHFREAGFTIGSLHDRDDVLAALMNLPDEELMEEIRFHISIDFFRKHRDIEARLRADLPELVKNREELAQLLDRGNCSFNYLAHYPAMLFTTLDSPIVKKNRDPEFAAMRRAIAASPLNAQLYPEVRSELAAWDA